MEAVLTMPVTPSPLGEVLARYTREGELYEKLSGDRVRCFSCGHRCLIPPGQLGICKVRYNEGGVLRVPFGYVGALQVDPVEKKPFFHALPGSRALSFGMLGCDLHCGYCFTGDTVVVTDEGPTTFTDLFASCERTESRPDAELAYPQQRHVVAASGRWRRVAGVVRHPYRGSLVTLHPLYLPALKCTPDHRVYATADPESAPTLVPAKDLMAGQYLAVPRHFKTGAATNIDVASLLAQHTHTHRVTWDLPHEQREWIMMASAQGQTSRAIGLRLGKDASYIRHVRSKIARGRGQDARTHGLSVQDGRVRFPHERGSGIPASVSLDPDFAALLGYYCAEGCVVRSKKRPGSYVLNFAFSHREAALVARVCELLDKCLGIKGRVVTRATTLAVVAGTTSGALLFKTLAGGRSAVKRVPSALADAPEGIVQAFLDAYVEGDGHRYADGKVSATTVSATLAHGVAWLALRNGFLPSVYAKETCGDGMILGRRVSRAPVQYTVVWYLDSSKARQYRETADYYLVPLRTVGVEPYEGHVYNMEVEEEHSYLAGFFAVSNCQNWVTSQALRDPAAVSSPQEMDPGDLVRLARKYDARIVTSTYNEPLITSEWGMAVFREAKAAGLVCSYVSNGNGTPEVLDYIQPYVSLYKVDLKSFRDRPYRELGGTLAQVLWTIRALHERGFWLEIVTLLVPGFNDGDDELRDLTQFLVSVSPDIPWHVTAFHQDYKMTGPDDTSAETLLRAAEIGAEAGLHFVYAGNLPGQVGRWENTYCPSCRALLIERSGFHVRANRIENGSCPDCRAVIPGVWTAPVMR
jgi:pyruvate formate lyase activating enzyme